MLRGNSKLKTIFFLGFLLSLQLAFTSYINSSFLAAFSGEKNVALIYIFGSLLALLVLYAVPAILKKIGEYKFLLYSSAVCALALLSLSVLKNSFVIIGVFIVYLTLDSLIIFALDELLEIFSKNKGLGRIRGLYLTVINLAWVLAQVISGETLSKFTFTSLYFVGFIIMALFFVSVLFGLYGLKDPKYDTVLGRQSFKNFFSNKNLARAYIINFLLQFFFTWMVIYTPIYLFSHLGFTWKEIAFIFSVMLLPFVLIQFPLGVYSDKIGERRMLIFGFLVASLATLSLFFIRRHEVWIWALALFSTRVGAAIIEVMSDVYFFKHIQRENDEFIAIYRNTSPVSYVLAPLAAFILFAFIPAFNFIFLVLGALMLYGVYLSSRISRKDV